MPEIWENPLYQEVDRESGLVEKTWEYGYGGESYESYQVNTQAVVEFIEARERRMLDGMTLAEYVVEGEPG